MAFLNKKHKLKKQLQHDTMLCGVACLEMICEYYLNSAALFFAIYFYILT